MFRRPAFATLLALLSPALAGTLHAAPNFVLILADDQGWNGTSVQMDPTVPGSKSDFYQTPNLQELADAGMRFSNGYAAHTSCAPTRASLFTGKSPAQLQMTDLHHAQPGTALYALGSNLPLTGPTPIPFDPTQLTLPRLLKQVNPNYTTGIFGKWHMDVPATTTPIAAGFDAGVEPALPPDEVDPWGVQQVAGLSNDFMANAVAAGKPFFVQVSQRAPHAPVRSRAALRAKYQSLPPGAVHRDPAYAAMTEDLDASVGTVLDKIDQLGIADNTYVIYVSDNGAPLSLSSNTPLRLGKAGLYEGGIRVPFIIRGPGIQAGSFSEVPVVTTDIMGTIASIAGLTGPMPGGMESADISPVLFNGGDLPVGMTHLDRQFSQHGELYFHLPHNAAVGPTFRIRPESAVRDGDFKLYVEYGENGGPDKMELYNLRTNVSESVNLASAMPQKVAEMRAMLDNYLGAVDASQAYDVKTPVQLAWSAAQPGADPNGWRSTIDVAYKARELWSQGGGTQKPTLLTAASYQPGLAGRAFSFDGGDVMRRKFFHVSDNGPRQSTVNAGTPDFDRSASLDVWFRPLVNNQNMVLWESGEGSTGASLTLGDADANGVFYDLRFRVRGLNGASLDVTAPINEFVNPVADFVHATAVFSDNDNNRYLELYVNGALAARFDGPSGAANSIQWDGYVAGGLGAALDGYDEAGLGNSAGSGVGANGGTGNLPFVGGYRGQIAAANFWNTALTPGQVANNYNSQLDPVNYRIVTTSGNVLTPSARPTNVTLGVTESNTLQVMEERHHRRTNPLVLNALVNGGGTITAGSSSFAPGSVAANTDFISYLVHFDPLGSGAATAAGSITFAGDILGFILNGSSMAATDPLLGSLGDYGAMADRGVQLAGGDFLTVSADRRTLSFSLGITAANDLAQFRVVTQAGLAGDFNGDSIVDGEDLAAWGAAMGESAAADADGDGDSDGFDFLTWQRNYGAGASSSALARVAGASAAAAVPEPTGVALVLCAAAALGGVRLVRSRRESA